MSFSVHVHFGWPQIIYLGLWVFSFVMGAVLHGRERTGKYNFFVSAPASLIGIFLIYEGGFFGG